MSQTTKVRLIIDLGFDTGATLPMRAIVDGFVETLKGYAGRGVPFGFTGDEDEIFIESVGEHRVNSYQITFKED